MVLNKAEKRELLFTALKRAGGFAGLSERVDCALPNLVAYAAGIVEIPQGLLSSLQDVVNSEDTGSTKS